ncbi:Uncharacterised protein [Candidatus Tiddalikarchaeum anstoanum]|nr:Uncharacterised protein [Candidatus Tiddalikarchaeum anstoanum]
MEELDKVKVMVEDFCKGKFDIFYADNPPSQVHKDKAIFWRKINDVNDVSEFLTFLEAHNSEKTVYLALCRIREGDNYNREHVGEIFNVEVGFFFDNAYNCMSCTADWYYI